MLTIIPAIDLIDNKCVRLTQGNYSKKTIYHDDPLEMARILENQGADRLHIVDLDGAKSGQSEHLSLIRYISTALHIPIEVGGGIRSRDTAEQLLDAGVSKIIIGTAVVRDPEFAEDMLAYYPESCIFGIDARNGKIAVSGWEEDTKHTAIDTILHYQNKGLREIIYTDISRDGMMSGPNTEDLRYILDQSRVSVIASGGISSLDHINAFHELSHPRLTGFIIGKALYEKQLSLKEVRHHVDQME